MAGLVAESVAVTVDRNIHLDRFRPWEQPHGFVTAVRCIAKRKVCRSGIPQSFAVPSSFCREGRQVAVAFDYRAPLSNKVLTSGFSFVLHHRPPSCRLGKTLRSGKLLFEAERPRRIDSEKS